MRRGQRGVESAFCGMAHLFIDLFLKAGDAFGVQHAFAEQKHLRLGERIA